MGKAVDLTGQRFGRLVAIEPTEERRNGSVVWKCKCDCGNYTYVSTGKLRSGHTKSCGCISFEVTREKGLKHGIVSFKTHNKNVCIEGTKMDLLTCKIRSNNKSGVKGVSWAKDKQKWVAQIGFQRKVHCLGYFDKLEDATLTRKEAEEKYFAPILEKYGFVEK